MGCQPAPPTQTASPTQTAGTPASGSPPSTSPPTGNPASSVGPQSLWQAVTVEKDCLSENVTISAGAYFLFPVIETVDGAKSITQMVLAQKPDLKIEEIDKEKHRASDGTFAVFIPVVGRAELKTGFTENKARAALNPQIVSLWYGLSGGNHEWVSTPLKLKNPAPAESPGKKK
ncbi:MAG: hypothetical protein HY774_03855 [Acidobacteria bacterium]|nr:hypothetical protein [Acidobacteriota bacterium]